MSAVNRTKEELKGRSVFPAPAYRDTVLKQVFADAKRYYLHPLLEIEYAHTLMLARQSIMPSNEAAVCIHALDSLDQGEVLRAEYDGSCEDLFFLVEQKLATACGVEVAGKMHTARSRNDIDLTMYRMVLRNLMMQILGDLLDLRSCLGELAWEHRAALMPAYTHNQPAQPTTLGHYLMAFIEILERDCERIISAYARVNRSPMGACAITTTGFPIDRSFTEQLLGFEGLQVNSYGAIAAVDYLTESCSVLAVCMVNLGRFAQDMLGWSSVEFNYLRLSDAYVQVSSIMPQKRNPVPLEHVRVLASRALTQAQSILGCVHNTPFTDMNDAEDDLQPLVYTAFEDAHRSLHLLTGLLSEATFNIALMKICAESNFLSVTELADTLVRHTGISFHAAHQLVSGAVKELIASGIGYDPDLMTQIIVRELPTIISQEPPTITREQIRESLGARNFVDARRIPGGPAAVVLEPEILRAQRQIVVDRNWLEKTAAHCQEAHALLRRECDQLLRTQKIGQ